MSAAPSTDLLDALDDAALDDAAAEARAGQNPLHFDAEQALEWAREPSLERIEKLFTNLQQENLAQLFARRGSSADDLMMFGHLHFRALTERKMEAEEMISPKEEQLERYPDDQAWVAAREKPLYGNALSALGEQLCAAVTLREIGEDAFREKWNELRQTWAEILAARIKRLKDEQAYEQRVAQMREACAGNPTAEAVLEKMRLDNHYISDYIYYDPSGSITMVELAALLGAELPPVPSRK